jgi:hypothetical protein
LEREVLTLMQKRYKNYGIKFDWDMCGEAIDEVFQKLKESVK